MRHTHFLPGLLRLVLGLAVVVGSAGTAEAAPSISLVVSGTTGTGVTGSNVLEALPGDTITLDVLIHVDEEGLAAWNFDLYGTGVTAVGGIECPLGSSAGSYENFLAGGCYTGVSVIYPLQSGVLVSGSDVLGYDGYTLNPVTGALPQPVFVGRGVFTVDAGAPSIVLDGELGPADPPLFPVTASTVPEPDTAALLAIGLAGLGGLRRRVAGPAA